MKIITSFKEYRSERRSVVTIGNFDGVHRGHATLLAEAVAQAKKSEADSIVLTFEPHTRTVTSSNGTQRILSTFTEKGVLIEPMGIDWLIGIPFDRNFRNLSASEFIRNVLSKELRTRTLVMGTDHTFGKERTGNRNSLHEMLGKNDISMFSIDPVGSDNRTFSSTGIRDLISRGVLDEAVALLGHLYLIRATRITGQKIATKLGFPTLNFALPGKEKVLPPAGVYAARMRFLGADLNGALYLGDCPTFENRDVHFEMHLLTAPDRIPEPGESADLELGTFIRPDQTFSSPEALTAQIKQDIDIISRFFSEESFHANH